MARTPSTMLELGTRMPTFSLPNAADGRPVSNTDYENHPATLVMFICNHCPFVIHVQSELTNLCAEYGARGVGIVAINANSSTTHPQDGPENMKTLSAELGWAFPFLFDETQETAKAFQAACTPDFFLYDSAHNLVYRGQLVDSRPESGTPVTGADLRGALDAVLDGRPVVTEQRASLGCNIKWHPGQEPRYF